MTAFWMRTALVGMSALALQACTMTMDQAQYPPDREAAAPPPPAQPPAPRPPADPHDPVAQPTPSVTGQPLPPPAATGAGPVSENTPTFLFISTEPVALRTIPAAYHHRRARTRSESSDDSDVQHIRVKKGETLKDIAARYGSTPREIMKANHIRHPGDLIPGERLIIPASSKHPPSLRQEEREAREASAKTPKTYKVKRGDTIYSIGRLYKIPPGQIMKANGYGPTTRLHVGEVVKLPRSPADVEAEEQAAADAAAARRLAANNARQRPHETLQAPTTQTQTQALNTTALPDHPIPYTSLPNRVAQPPARSMLPPPSRQALAPPVIPQEPPAGPPDAQVLLAGKGRFIWPVQGQVVSTFGPKPGGQRNDGVDIAAPVGAPVHAAAAGDVVYAGSLPDLGNLVLIKHDDGWITAYAHLSRAEVKIRDHVTQGEEVGLAGQSGTAVQPEVYFEIRYAPTPRDKAKPVDPALLLASQ